MAKKWRQGWWVALAVGFLLLIAVILILRLRPGIQVTIQNSGMTLIRAVVLHVSGASLFVHPLAAGRDKPQDFIEARYALGYFQ